MCRYFLYKTHNLGFVNKVICCRNEMNGDTLMVNQKIPITTVYDGVRIYDKGLLNGIFPRKNNVYIIVIQTNKCFCHNRSSVQLLCYKLHL